MEYVPIESKGHDGDQLMEFRLVSEKIFHVKNFYKFLYEYLIEEGYNAAVDNEEVQEIPLPEVYYDEWRHPNGMTERRVWWRFIKNPEGKGGRYRYYIDVNMRMLAIRNIETVISGKKKKVQIGEVEVGCFAYLKIFNEDIKKHKLIGPFYNIFKNRWYKNIFEGYEDDLKNSMKAFQDAVKEFMNIETYDKGQKTFHLDRGLAKTKADLPSD